MPETIIQGGVSVFGLVVSGYDTIADLRSQPIADSPLWTKRSLAMTFGSATPLDGTFGFYAWDPTSVAADDGVNVIKPTLITGEGRWRLIGSTGGGGGGEVCIEGDNVCFGGECPDQVLRLKNITTGQGNRIDTIGADGVQTIRLGDGEVCISPFTPSFNCTDGACVDPGDGSGTYATLEECETACGVTPSWNCVAGNCVDPGDGSGTYASLAECQTACCEYCGDEFETYALGDVTGDTDLDDGCCWIGAWNLAADPILAVGVEEFTEYPDGPAGVLNGGTGFTGAWVIP